MTCAVLTVSDSTYAGTRVDESGPLVADRIREAGWTVASTATVPDEVETIAGQLQSWCESRSVRLILTTGGTGVSPRDLTPEATRMVIEKEIPGLGELMRTEGMKKTRRACLSRATAGLRDGVLIVNLPGSPKGARESLDAIVDLIPHILDLASGVTEHK
jgi:molybdenum cofactor synthesis domain-containing protein